MRFNVNSLSQSLILSAQNFADWTRILRSPNRAEFILVAIIVGSAENLILYFFSHSIDLGRHIKINEYFIRLLSMTLCLMIEEFVQFSIASRLPSHKLLLNCGKYALGWWALELICLLPIVSYLIFLTLPTNSAYVGLLVFIYVRVLTIFVFFTATLTRYFSLTTMKKYAILLFFIQLIFHVFWNVNIAQSEDGLRTIFLPLRSLEAHITH